MTHQRHETALVLSGGGAYGAFAVGVMKVLFAGRGPSTNYEPLVANIFTGTSVGAFNAAMIVGSQGGSLLENAMYLESVWLDRIAEQEGQCGNGIFRFVGDPLDYFDPACFRSPSWAVNNFLTDGYTVANYIAGRTANFLASRLPVRERFLGLFDIGSFVDSRPFQDLLASLINEHEILVSPQRLNIVATNWISGAAVHFCNTDFQQGLGIQAILASSAIPGIFPPVRIGNNIYVDGGTVENTPLNPAINLGATELHVIYLDPKPQYVPLLGSPNTADTLMRVYHLMLAIMLKEDIETARWINSGLQALASIPKSENATARELRDVVRVAGRFLEHETMYKPITIHRYFPEAAVGGQLGSLDFTSGAISKVIAEGERTALLHNCETNKCLFPVADRQVSYA